MSKKIIYLTCLALALGAVVSNTASAADPSLVGWWKLDETSGTTASDSSGNNFNGTLNGNPQWVAGQIDGALQLNGTTDYVVTPSINLTSNTVTMTAWVKRNGDQTGWAGIVFHRATVACGMGFSGQVINQLQYHWNDNNANTYNFNSGLIVPNNEWAFVAVVIEPSKATLYVNRNSSVNAIAHITQALGAIDIGQDNNGSRFVRGAIDDARIYSRSLSDAEIQAMIPLKLKAYNPVPVNGATNMAKTVIQWTPGETAAAHDVYFGSNETAVTNATTASDEYIEQTNLPYSATVSGLQKEATTYYWRIDEVVDETTTIKGDIWHFTTAPLKAHTPVPANGTLYVDPNLVLTWGAGFNVKTTSGHRVYFGTDATAVANATTSTAGIYKGAKSSPGYSTGALANNTNYYWRIDEVNKDATVTKGDVWMFKTIPIIPITDPNLVGWWKLDEVQGTKALDSSGHGNHGTVAGGAQWVTGYDGGALDFDGLDDYVQTGKSLLNNVGKFTMAGWVSARNYASARIGLYGQNDCIEFGLNNSTAEIWTTAGGQSINTPYTFTYPSWHHVTAVGEGSRLVIYIDGQLAATGGSSVANYESSGFGFNIGGVIWDAAGNWFSGQLDDVRLYNKALTQAEVKQAMRGDIKLAWDPKPTNGSSPGLDNATPMSWMPGSMASMHDVYFGVDRMSVEDATTSTAGIYRGRQIATNYTPLGALQDLQTYYWRIDEYNTDATISKGKVWSFTVGNYIIVDNFEDYNDYTPKRIFETWIDGLGYVDPPPGNSGNGTTSMVGYAASPFAEQTYIHGGKQAMPMDYDNTRSPYYAETDRTFATPKDFTAHGVKALSLWFRGWPAATGSFTEAPAGTYTIRASGADIWDVTRPRETWFHDEFHYAYQLVSGATITAIARVESIVNTNVWAKAGVMLRDSLDANSPHVSIYMTPGSGTSLQYRTTIGAASGSTTTAGITLPQYVKLEIDTAGARGYYSPDGVTWTQVGDQQTLYMTAPMYIGLAVTSHDAALTTTARFTNVSITGGTGTWGHQDIGIKNNIAKPLYVALQDSTLSKIAVVTHPDANAALNTAYQQWDIDLKSFTGVNPAAIKKIFIGVGNRSSPTPGGAGTIYIDDIRVYRPRCFPGLIKPTADFDDSCVVDYPDIGILMDNWLIQDYQVVPSNPGTTGLAGWWKFEGNLLDSSGGGHTGDPCGTTPTYTAGKDGQAVVLDGTDYVRFGAVGIDSNDARTVAGWAKASTTNIPDWTNVFGFTNSLTTGQANRSFDIERRGGGEDFYCVHVYGWERNIAPLDLDWHHLAATYDMTTIKCYADGHLASSAARAINTLDNVQMGKRGDNDNRFPGLVDDVRVYNRALTQGEVAYLAGKTTAFQQRLDLLLMPQDPAINMYNDGVIDLKDYALVADTWLDELLWPQ